MSVLFSCCWRRVDRWVGSIPFSSISPFSRLSSPLSRHISFRQSLHDRAFYGYAVGWKNKTRRHPLLLPHSLPLPYCSRYELRVNIRSIHLPRPLHIHPINLARSRLPSSFFPPRISLYLPRPSVGQVRPFALRSTFAALSPVTVRALYAALILSLIFGVSIVLLAFTTPNSTVNLVAYQGYVFCYALVRVTRDIYTVLRIVFDYLWSLYGLDPESALYKAKIEEVHWRCAALLRDCFNANGGVYIKFGQHLAQMMYLLPDPYCLTMQSMLQQAPASPFPDIQAIVKAQLGKPIEEIFTTFSSSPVASASLAQVHFATLLDGTEVAVKIQHRFLQYTIDADITVVRYLVHMIHWLFPAFDYGWLANEMSLSLPKEVDFLLEGKNADMTRDLLAHRDDVLIPKIYWDYSTSRILTMERAKGIMVGKTEELVKAGFSKTEISTLIAEVFSELIFTHGRVHADPHPGNVYIGNYKSTHHPVLILLDHGLYSVISDEFRLQYANLWHALIFADKEKIARYAKEMNAGELYPLFAAMLTRRPWDDVSSKSLASRKGTQITEFQREELQQYVATYGMEIQRILATVPQELVLLLKTNECLRHIDSLLGTSNETFLIMARFCTAAINKDRWKRAPGLTTWLVNGKEWTSMEVRILLVEIVISMGQWIDSIKEWMGVMTVPWRLIVKRLRKEG